MKNKILKSNKKKVLKKTVAKKTTPKAKTITKETPKETSFLGIHRLKVPKGAHKKKKLLGRGSSSGHGKTSTRGSKGQTARAGRDFYLGFEGGQMPLIRKIPKRGFTSIFKKEFQIVNLKDLNRIKEATINLDLLEEKGLIKNRNKLVKILGEGEIENPITICAHAFSKSAADKITNAGGKIEIIKC